MCLYFFLGTILPKVEGEGQYDPSESSDSLNSRKPTKVQVVHKAPLQIVRVRSLPASVTLNSIGLKRSATDACDADSSAECYFDAKRQRREDTSNVGQSPATQGNIVNKPVQLVSPVHIVTMPGGPSSLLTPVSAACKPAPQSILQPKSYRITRVGGQPIARAISTPISSHTAISLLSPQSLISPIVNHEGLAITPSPVSLGQLKPVKSIAPSTAIVNLLPHLQQPVSKQSFVKCKSADFTQMYASAHQPESYKPTVLKSSAESTTRCVVTAVTSKGEAVRIVQMDQILSPNSFFRSTPSSLVPGQSLIPPLSQAPVHKPVSAKNTALPEQSAAARKLQLCHESAS